MASSYIEFRSRAVRLNDQVCLLVGLLAEECFGDEYLHAGVEHFISELKQQGLAAPPGMIDVELQAFHNDASFRTSMKESCEALKCFVSSYGDFVPGEFFETRAGETPIEFVDTQATLIIDAIQSLQKIFE
ncbi:hypothetical protein [Stieleria varia]|uniref:Uncharacterized protein n=1 Tax=Stieleria varia TaxID=2528005 RepID=A0A5C6B1Z4_9BACT|nr:hypothetical protein [Stieleria varia]TWU04414.1 hypothetical protein Pla52n_24540 [Stieleria varia]